MPEPSNYIDQEQYNQYTDAWLSLINGGSASALQQAFKDGDVERITFLTFSIDQIMALVTATDVQTIKARLLLMPDGSGDARFTTTLFATDAQGRRLSEYYIPTQPAATTTQSLSSSAQESTKIPQATAVQWLTDWVDTPSLTADLFTTATGPLQGSNFEVSTFQDPLADAQPYAGKGLFLNLGLYTPDTAPTPTLALVVYVNALASRTQGTIAGLPTDDSYYDMGTPSPPAP